MTLRVKEEENVVKRVEVERGTIMTETEAGTETGIEGDGSNDSAIEGQIKLNLLLPRSEFTRVFTSFWWGILVKFLVDDFRSMYFFS